VYLVLTLPGTIVHFLLTGLDLLFFPFFTEPSNGPITLSWYAYDKYSVVLSLSCVWYGLIHFYSSCSENWGLILRCEGLLVICNAILCSVAVWNLSYAQSVGQNCMFLIHSTVQAR
jgi:hypothetical protein